MASAQLLSLPDAATGLAPLSSASAWAFGTPVSFTSPATDIDVIGLAFENTTVASAGGLQETLFEITIGGTTKLQIPFNSRNGSLVGYYQDQPAVQTFYLSQPYFIPAGAAVAVRVTDSIAAALTYNGVKLLYREAATVTTALNTPADVSTTSNTTPTLNFTGTSDDAIALEYNVQVDTLNTFDSVAGGGGLGPSPTYQATGTEGFAGSGNATPGLPTGWAADDIFLLYVISLDNVTPTFPGGWTSLNTTTNGAGMITTVAWRRAVAGDTAPLVTHTGGSTIYSRINNYRGASGAGTTNSPFSVVGTPKANAASVTITANAITPNSGDHVVFIGTRSGNATHSSWDVTNPTLATEFNTTSTYSTGGGNSAGGITVTNTETTNTSLTNIGQLLAIIPASLPGPLLSKRSVTPDAGFTAGHPFASGVAKDFTVQAANALATGTYYWRVAGVRSGSTLYGGWATTRSFTVSIIPDLVMAPPFAPSW
jgi:hypothetical protein